MYSLFVTIAQEAAVQLAGMTCVTAEGAVEDEGMCVTEGSIAVGGENNIPLQCCLSTLVEDAWPYNIADWGNVVVYDSSHIGVGESDNCSRVIPVESTVA